MIDIDIDYLVGQQALPVLDTIFRKRTIPHAMLFAGMEGVGKQSVARRFAMVCNCLERLPGRDPSSGNGGSIFSGECPCASCGKIRSGNHPDIHWVTPRGNFIKIEQIRALCDQLAMKPYEARRRFAILSHADAMNPEAANALLKMLEEPPAGTVFILTTARPDALLPTVRSRVQTIRFNPLPDASVKDILTGEAGLDAASADLFATMSGGSPTRLWSETPINEWVALRNWLMNVMEKSLDSDGPEPGVGDTLAFAETLFRLKNRLETLMEMLLLWFRDVLICRYRPDAVLNRDRLEPIRRMAERYGASFLFEKMEAVTTFQRAMRGNANLRLALEAMAFRLLRRI